MSTVELHVNNLLLDEPEFKKVMALLPGKEVRRRPQWQFDDVTIFDMQMDGAPPTAAVMEVVMQRLHGIEGRVKEIRYFDAHGIFIAPIVPFPEEP